MVAFFASPLGGDVEKNGNFQEGKYVHMVPFFLYRFQCSKAILTKMANGGDLDENGNSKDEKIIMHG